MLIIELMQEIEKHENIKERHTKRQSDKYFMNIETDLKELEHELKQMQGIYNNLDANINNFLNNNDILQGLIIGYYHFKSSYKIFKDVEIITDNKKLNYITNSHIKTIKQVINYYEKIINELNKKANETQKENIKKFDKHYKK